MLDNLKNRLVASLHRPWTMPHARLHQCMEGQCMQKRAFVEHFVGGRLTALSSLTRGYLVVVSMPRHAAICKLTALSRGKRHRDGECEFNKALILIN